jgi:diguanylate cyclase
MKFDLDDIWLAKMEGLTGLSQIQKRRLYRMILVWVIGISYLVDTLFLALFNVVGLVDFSAVIFYGCAGLGHVLIFSAIHWSGLCDHFKNPHLTIWGMVYAIIVQVISITLAPKLAAFFMGIMFIIYAFGALRISMKEALIIWFLASIAILLALLSVEDPSLALWIPNNVEGILIAASFSIILLRSIAISFYSTTLRLKLFEKSIAFEKAASHDELTGLYNRSIVLPAISEKIALCKRKSIISSVAMMDIDDFKIINDTYGHTAGDQVLTRLGRYLSAKVRDSEIVARYGGEEFIVLLPFTSNQEAMDTIERIRKGVEGMIWEGRLSGCQITLSCGIAEVYSYDTVDSVIKRADKALYRAKSSGKNQVCVFKGKDTASTIGDST